MSWRATLSRSMWRGLNSTKRVLEEFEKKFGEYLKDLKWVNFGGGHHITREGYDIKLLIDTLNSFKKRYPHLEVYLELGEAVGWQTGVLVNSTSFSILLLTFSKSNSNRR